MDVAQGGALLAITTNLSEPSKSEPADLNKFKINRPHSLIFADTGVKRNGIWIGVGYRINFKTVKAVLISHRIIVKINLRFQIFLK